MQIISWLFLVPIAAAIRCVNFYGLETEGETLVCTWVKPVDWYLQDLKKRINIDTVRLPFSHQLIASEKGLAKLDEAVAEISKQNLDIILDYHRTFNTHQSPGPDKEISLDRFVCAWTELLSRYQSNPFVKGVDVFNEIQGPDKNYASSIQSQVVNRLESTFPRRFYYYIGGVSWGKDVGGMTVNLTTSNYSLSVHEYGFFNEPLAPRYGTNERIFVGEFGFEVSEYTKAKTMVDFYHQKGIRDVCFWTIAHSQQTGGLYADDCITPIQEKMAIFNSIFEYPSQYLLRGSFS